MAIINFFGRTTSSISINITAGGGETAFELELNRSPDFASDDSILLVGLAAGVTAVTGLPSDTPFYARARKTNAGVGAWSTSLLAATSPPAAPPAYVGFSIEPAILVVPEPIDQLTVAGADVGSDPANLLDDDPQAVCRSDDATVAIIFHTPGRKMDVVALLGTLLGPTATWRIRCSGSSGTLTSAPTYDSGNITFHASPNLGRRPYYHGYHRLPAVRTDEWWRIDVASQGNTNIIMRNVLIGLARQSVNYSRGAGRGFADLGTMSRNRLGTPDRVVGWRGRTLDFGLSWLTESEYEAKWSDLDMLVGGTDPVFILTNPKANAFLHDRIGFGTIEQTRSENVRSSRWQKSLEIRSIY